MRMRLFFDHLERIVMLAVTRYYLEFWLKSSPRRIQNEKWIFKDGMGEA